MAAASLSEHWEAAYRDRPEEALTWFEDTAERSRAWISRHATPAEAVIDIGGGASRLAGELVKAGHRDVTVLDLSSAAMEVARNRLGDDAGAVRWVVADVRRWRPDAAFAVWHDRAAFHFLTEAEDQAAYVATLLRAVSSGGTAIIATFADDGPETCSGLPVRRYAPQELARTLSELSGNALIPIEAERFDHVTPKGNIQRFQISAFRRLPS